MEFLRSWKPDIITFIITFILSPLIIYIAKKTLEFLKKVTGFVIEGIFYWVGRTLKQSIATRLSMKKYCSLLLDGPSKFLHVPARTDVSLETDKAYVTLSLEKTGIEQKKADHENLLNLGNRIRIIGDPGSGKSSLVKRLERDMCKKSIYSYGIGKFPIRIELKKISFPESVDGQELGNWLFETIRAQTVDAAVYRIDECLEIYLKENGILLLLDGLDEISSQNYPKAALAINNLSEKLDNYSSNNTILLTMRTQFHVQIKDDFQENFPHVAFLKPFTPTDIYEFLSLWPFGKNREKEIYRIYSDLSDQPTLREMCTNPLILAMYVADDQSSYESTSPDSRTDFYSKVTEELLIKRRLRQTGPELSRKKLREQRENILGKLALNHLLDPTQSANTLNWNDAVKIVSKIVGCNNSESEDRLRKMSKETGLFSEEKYGETLRFIHLTFCEYLAANEVIHGELEGWKKLLETHKSFVKESDAQNSTRLLEVIPFTCGLMPRIQRENALSDLEKIGDRQLLARSFMETKMYDHRCWGDFVVGERDYLLKVKEENWDEEWLRRLHLFNVVIKDAELSANYSKVKHAPVNLEDFFKSLVDKQKTSLNSLFSTYASYDASVAFRLAEVCKLDLAMRFPNIIIENCNQPPFFSQVMTHAENEPERKYLWASLISEACIKAPLVAFWVREMESFEEWEKTLKITPKKEYWFSKGFIEETFLTQCFSIAFSKTEKIKIPEIKNVDKLRKVLPPGSTSLVNYSQYISFFISFSLMIIIAFSLYADIIKLDIPFLSILLFINVMVFMIISALDFRKNLIAKFYGIITNFAIYRESFSYIVIIDRLIITYLMVGIRLITRGNRNSREPYIFVLSAISKRLFDAQSHEVIKQYLEDGEMGETPLYPFVNDNFIDMMLRIIFRN
ncbi:MAG: NACHT domain-containing protein [Chloroflexi bacterium]|jgi:hypothetical protein|nr:NACHT domain-containing protein [Chloroflexota bacterium]MBT3670875.1 NACHT domain-containing protein [Chloroflexota bacterium]MBT4003673.1 NACHT domain-containing protein [Chloroflexota bacterium]MBT4305188.1 NACHT domain-containing protein [Chloroflexota bacterium]MBT4534587.1 NACHT domain-containing protein [Chloroflexota bacterium]